MFAGETPRDLTLGDAARAAAQPGGRAASRRWWSAQPGLASAAASARCRSSARPPSLLGMRRWRMAQGQFLPPGDPERATNVCVIGAKVRSELLRRRARRSASGCGSATAASA